MNRRWKNNKEPTNGTKSANNNNNKYIYRDFESCTVSVTHSSLCYPFRLFSKQVRAHILLLYIVITSSRLLPLLPLPLPLQRLHCEKRFFLLFSRSFPADGVDSSKAKYWKRKNPPYSKWINGCNNNNFHGCVIDYGTILARVVVTSTNANCSKKWIHPCIHSCLLCE